MEQDYKQTNGARTREKGRGKLVEADKSITKDLAVE